jgi:ABC-type multidrug transport system fused ATPase/permease subunit
VQWPHSGLIKFDDVCFSYAKNLPPVLNNLTFAIQPREKVGVVGRTGASKSSIVQALWFYRNFSGLRRLLIFDFNVV